MSSYEQYYEDLVKYLIYNHCHSHAKERRVKVQRGLINSLDFDQAGELIEVAGEDEELKFIHVLNGKVWYEQTEPMLKYVRDETSICLETLPKDKFHHLKPPELREKYL